MSKLCGHVKVWKLILDYGFAYSSGWEGIGIAYRCPRCFEVLWFKDDTESNDHKEITNNTLKRKQNLKWKPRKKVGPHPYKHYSMKRFNREINVKK